MKVPLAWAVVALLGTAACAPESESPADGSGGTAGRIVTLAPHLAELVHAAGAGDRLVAVSAYTDYPPSAAALPTIGDAFAVDLEALRLLAPDLVLAWESGMPAHTLEGIRQHGFRVVTLRTRKLEEIVDALRTVGRLTGTEVTAAAEIARFHEGIESLRSEYAEAGPVRVFYQVSARPLYTINGDHFIGELIDICGGRNVFADLDLLAPAVDVEAVLAADPQVIIANTDADSLAHWTRFDTLSANRYDNLLTVDAEFLARASTRLDAAGRKLCEALDSARNNLPGS